MLLAVNPVHDQQQDLMGLTRVIGSVGPERVPNLGVVRAGELILRGIEEHAPRVLAGITVRPWCHPPVLDPSRVEIIECGLWVESAGLSGVCGGFAVGYLERVTVEAELVVARDREVESRVKEFVVVEHLEYRSVSRGCEVGQVDEEQSTPSAMLIFIRPRHEAGSTGHPSLAL